MKHICVGNRTSTGSDNGLSPGRRQAIIWTNGGILLIGSLGTNFSEILIEIQTFFVEEYTFENVVWKMAAILSLNGLIELDIRDGGYYMYLPVSCFS